MGQLIACALSEANHTSAGRLQHAAAPAAHCKHLGGVRRWHIWVTKKNEPLERFRVSDAQHQPSLCAQGQLGTSVKSFAVPAVAPCVTLELSSLKLQSLDDCEELRTPDIQVQVKPTIKTDARTESS